MRTIPYFPRGSDNLFDYQGFFDSLLLKFKELVTFETSNTSTIQSTSSTSYSALTSFSTTVSKLVETDVVVFLTQVQFSTQTAGEVFRFRQKANSDTSFEEYPVVSSLSNTAGNVESKNMFSVWTGLSGSVDFTTEWARASGSGSIYCKTGKQTLLTFKT